MVDFEFFLITFCTGLGTILSSFLLYSKIKHLNVSHLNRVSLGIFMLGLLPWSFTPQAFFQSNDYNNEMTALITIGAVSTISGLILITWNLKIHQNVTIPKRNLLGIVTF